MTSIDTGIGQLFHDGFAGTTVTPDDPDYDTSRRLWNATADGRPAVVARCRTVADVATAVALTRRAEVLLAVRGGGHSLAGFSTCDGGVVIDLGEMRAVA